MVRLVLIGRRSGSQSEVFFIRDSISHEGRLVANLVGKKLDRRLNAKYARASCKTQILDSLHLVSGPHAVFPRNCSAVRAVIRYDAVHARVFQREALYFWLSSHKGPGICYSGRFFWLATKADLKGATSGHGVAA